MSPRGHIRFLYARIVLWLDTRPDGARPWPTADIHLLARASSESLHVFAKRNVTMYDIATFQGLAYQGYLITLAFEHLDSIGPRCGPKKREWPEASSQGKFVLDLCVDVDRDTIIEAEWTEAGTREIIGIAQKELSDLLGSRAAWPPDRCRELLRDKAVETRSKLAGWLRCHRGSLPDGIDAIGHKKQYWSRWIAELDCPDWIASRRFKELFSVSRTLRYENVFKKAGDVWVVRFAGREVRRAFSGDKGMHHIMRLLATPNMRLTFRDFGHAPDSSYRGDDTDGALYDYVTLIEATGVVLPEPLDEKNVECLNIALREVKARIEECEYRSTTTSTAIAELEEQSAQLEKVRAEIARYDLAKRRYVPKAIPKSESATKIKEAISRAVRRAMGEIKSEHEALWNHLRVFLEPVAAFTYHPDQDIAWIVN